MPTINSTHALIAPASRGAPVPSRVEGQSRYVYLFPDLAGDPLAGCFAGTTPAQTQARLRAFEKASRQPLSGLPALQMRLPAAYTYFGQFVNHDISAPVGDVVGQPDPPPPMGVIDAVDPPGLDRTQRASTATIVSNLVNEHAHPLCLDSLYGDGPDSTDPEIAALYEPDGKRFRLGLTRREPDQHFLDRTIDPARVHHDSGAPDILRRDHRALIADRRNDENVIVSQLHLALMLLHNKAVAALEGAFPDPATCFAKARQLMTLHYHWLILNDYLPKLLSPSVLGKPLASWPSRLTEPAAVPLEFTSAAFRFGHSMVGATYDYNANFGSGGRIRRDGATLEQLFEFTTHQNMQTAAPETLALPDHWVIDWRRMTRMPPRLGGAEQIDLIFARDILNNVGTSEVAAHGSILFRNLMRGYHRRIPFGQILAQRYQVAPLTADEIRAAMPLSLAGDAGLRKAAEDLGFLDETPAWIYFLCEARAREGGDRIGPTASHIIADTIVGLMQLEPRSILNDQGGKWHPRQSPLKGAQSLTSIRKLLLYAVKDTAIAVT